MGLKPVSKEEVAQQRHIILIYGVAGSGKTRLATSLPDAFGEIIYIALDDGSENLDSVLAKYRDRVHVYRPDGKDPIVDGGDIATTPWSKLHPGAKTLVIDTFTTWTWDMLRHITNEGMFSSKRVRIGEGTKLATALPDVGEYGGVHAEIRLFLSVLFHNQRDMNIIVLAHSDPPEAGRGAGGPATVGKKMTEWLPGRFKTVIRIDKETSNQVVNGTVVQTTRPVARSAQHGEWIARINENSEKGNPMPVVPLDIDPVNFWVRYLALKNGATTK